ARRRRPRRLRRARPGARADRAPPRRLRRDGRRVAHRRRRPAALPVRAAAVGRMTAPRASTLEHWESYWKGHQDLDRTYSTGGRLAREVLRDGDVRGQRVLEVGAGSGRDALALARDGAVMVVLDYAPASLALVRDQARRAGVAVGLVRSDALAMPFREGAFD